MPEIENSLAIFCMATYGEGDPTDNAQEFNDWLMETEVDLTGLKYAVCNKTVYQNCSLSILSTKKRFEETNLKSFFNGQFLLLI